MLLGQPDNKPQSVPSWPAFNAIACSNSQVTVSTVYYLPVIPESPTKLATVHEILLRSCRIAHKLQQSHVIITIDQAIYIKAKDIVWKHQSSFFHVVLRLGAFPHCLCVSCTIGKRFGDADLRELLVKSGIVGPSTVESVLTRNNYNRAVRVHKSCLRR